MPIKVKTAAALLGIFLALFVGAWAILEQAVRPGFVRLEAQTQARDRARVEANLKGVSRDLEARALDYARWDDTYAYIGGHKPGYIAENFTDDWFVAYGVDVVVFADDRGRILWSRGVGLDGRAAPFAEDAGLLLREARTISRRRSLASHGVVWSGRSPILFAAAPATRTTAVGQPHGLVIMGKRLHQDALAQQVQSTVQFVNTADAPPSIAERLQDFGDAATQSWQNPTTLYTLIALRGGDDALAGAVLVERQREIAALGANSIGLALTLFVLMSALAIAALWIVIDRVVISRVVRLEQHFNTQDVALSPYADAGVHDEIGLLTRSYNSLVQRLRLSALRERDTELARQAATGANRMKSAFLANISHELRTPLSDVIGYAELIEEDLSAAGITRSHADLHNIRTAAQHLLALVNEIFDLSKIEAGRLEMMPQSFPVEEMLNAAIAAARPIARHRGNAFVVDIAATLSTAYTDEQRLRQALTNLLVHACEATENGTVALTARRVTVAGRAHLHFEVRDDGPPLSEDQLARLFEPFAEPKTSSTFRRDGADLGPAIALKLANLLGGRIEAESTASGTVFTLLVPANVHELASGPNGAAPSSVQSAA